MILRDLLGSTRTGANLHINRLTDKRTVGIIDDINFELARFKRRRCNTTYVHAPNCPHVERCVFSLPVPVKVGAVVPPPVGLVGEIVTLVFEVGSGWGTVAVTVVPGCEGVLDWEKIHKS